ncbi:uncharacterized protein LOC112054906 [Bicyclus anynana]|uniref:Uncharacterized protein LOC112054906 n=1 Tax=Bicyclus anynana TaxID=110368 RepID=A0ABM3M0K8_BICAN|nr:uncharacterized protein LOC112054906 [Bicyclus anynana]
MLHSMDCYNKSGGNIISQQYTLNFDSPIYLCSDEESQAYIDTSEVQVKRYNETTVVMTGIFKLLKAFEQGTMIEIIAEKEAGGVYEMVFSHEICNICKELTNPESLYKTYMGYFGFPAECPFEPVSHQYIHWRPQYSVITNFQNDYNINDLVTDTEALPLNIATEGRYQVTMNMYKSDEDKCLEDKEFLACLKLDFLVETV